MTSLASEKVYAHTPRGERKNARKRHGYRVARVNDNEVKFLPFGVGLFQIFDRVDIHHSQPWILMAFIAPAPRM